VDFSFHIPFAGYILIVIWSGVTLAVGGIGRQLKPEGWPVWLVISVLLAVYFAGHVVQAAFAIYGLPGVPQVLMFPLAIFAFPSEYYNSMRVAGWSADSARSASVVWGGLHALLVYVYLAANVIVFLKLRKNKGDIK